MDLKALWNKMSYGNQWPSEMAQAYMPGNGYNDQQDALRHMLWMAELQRKFSYYPAYGLSLFKEGVDKVKSETHPLETAMDLHNNRVAMKAMKGLKKDRDVMEQAQRLLSKAKKVSSMEEYEKVKDLDVPVYIADYADLTYSPEVFGDNFK
jgi:hypothetical protein